MKEVQNRYQFIIGFVAIIISLSAFKDELGKLPIDLGFVRFSASQYLLFLIVSFVVLVHLYAVPYILSSTRFAASKLLNKLEYFSYGLFILLLSSPSLLVIIYLIKIFLARILSLSENATKIVLVVVSGVAGVLASSLAKKLIAKIKQYAVSVEQNNFEVKEIKAFETARSLFDNKYYAQSYLESFKALENSLFKRLRQEELIFRQGSFMQMADIAKKYNLISLNEFDEIQKIRAKRNSISHSTAQEVTKDEAESVLQFARELVGKIEVPLSPKVSEEVMSSQATSKAFNQPDFVINSYFNGVVLNSLAEAKAKSKIQNKPIFMVIYDSKSATNSKINYSLKYFTEYETTKSLLSTNFIQLLIDKYSIGVEEYLSMDEPLENCLLVVIAPSGEVLKTEGVYANPDEGLRRVKDIIEKWNNMN